MILYLSGIKQAIWPSPELIVSLARLMPVDVSYRWNKETTFGRLKNLIGFIPLHVLPFHFVKNHLFQSEWYFHNISASVPILSTGPRYQGKLVDKVQLQSKSNGTCTFEVSCKVFPSDRL